MKITTIYQLKEYKKEQGAKGSGAKKQTKEATTSALNDPRMEFKIATINLCLGLNSKKNLIKETIHFDKIYLFCMQETEIIKNLNHDLLSFPGYSIEMENKCKKLFL